MRLWMLSLFLIVGCSSTPDRVILKSENPAEENWQSIWDNMDFEISTEKKGAFLHTKWVDVMVGRIGGGIRLDDKQRVDRIKPTKKIWGIKFVRWFYEPFVWKYGSNLPQRLQ